MSQELIAEITSIYFFLLKINTLQVLKNQIFSDASSPTHVLHYLFINLLSYLNIFTC